MEGDPRGYADKPMVGVGVVIMRPTGQQEPNVEFCLTQRGHEPAKGKWSFPGGRLRLGETLLQCAAREAMEETALDISGTSQVQPMPFTAVDSIHKDQEGKIVYHYTIVEVAAVLPRGCVAMAGSDADDVTWKTFAQMQMMKEEMAEQEAHLKVAQNALDCVLKLNPQIFQS